MRGVLCCPHRSEKELDSELLRVTQIIEARLGQELIIASGVRCEECNKKVGGKFNSAHLRGHALDIEAPNSQIRFHLVSNFINEGITRIGINFAKGFIHIDNDKTLPQEVLFGY